MSLPNKIKSKPWSMVPPTDKLAAEIVEQLEAALEEFRGLEEILNQAS